MATCLVTIWWESAVSGLQYCQERFGDWVRQRISACLLVIRVLGIFSQLFLHTVESKRDPGRASQYKWWGNCVIGPFMYCFVAFGTWNTTFSGRKWLSRLYFFIVSCFSVQKSRKKGKKAKNLGQFLGGYETLGPLLGGYIPKYGLQHQRGHVLAYIFVHFWFLDPTDLSMYRVTWSEKVKETICFSPQERTRLNFSVRGREAVW